MFGYTVVCCYRIVSQRGGIESYSILVFVTFLS